MKTIAAILLIAATIGAAIADDRDYHYVDADPANGPAILRCRPATDSDIHICAILMPQGEVLNPKAMVGDTARWHVYLEEVGKPGDPRARAVVYVKPLTKTAGISMTIDLSSTSFDQPYRVLVIADPNAATFSEVHFCHGACGGTSMSTTRAALARAAANAAAIQAQAAAAQRRAYANAALDHIDKSACTNVADARYNPPSGTAYFKPLRVFNDGMHTCFEMPASLATFGFVLPYDGTALMHYTWRESDHILYVVGLPSRIDLKDGESVVTVTHQ